MSVGMCLILSGIAITQPANKEEFYSPWGCTQTLACPSKSLASLTIAQLTAYGQVPGADIASTPGSVLMLSKPFTSMKTYLHTRSAISHSSCDCSAHRLRSMRYVLGADTFNGYLTLQEHIF